MGIASDEIDDRDGHPGHPDHHHHLHVHPKTAVGALIAGVAVYEVLAMTVNSVLEEPVLPSSRDIVKRVNVRGVYDFLTPDWLRYGVLLVAGGVLGAAGVGATVVATTQLDTPEERARAGEWLRHRGGLLAHHAGRIKESALRES